MKIYLQNVNRYTVPALSIILNENLYLINCPEGY